MIPDFSRKTRVDSGQLGQTQVVSVSIKIKASNYLYKYSNVFNSCIFKNIEKLLPDKYKKENT